MPNLSKCTDGEITRFKNCLDRAGYDPAIIRTINTSPDNALANFMYASLMTRPEFALVHGVFTKQDDIITNFKARCAAKDIDLGKFSWIGSQVAPEFDTDDPEVVVVLDTTLNTLQNTFEFAWAWTVDGQDDRWRWDGMVSDHEKLALLDGLEFKPYTLRWVKIKLNTNIGKRPIDVRNSKSSPGCALLWMSAEHPVRIKATDYEKRFGFWLPGLKCTVPGERPFADVPLVHFYRGARQVGLCSNSADNASDNLAVPSLQE
jgi:hypothetical protein